MMRRVVRSESARRKFRVLALGYAILIVFAASSMAQQTVEKSNMELVGYSDLQGRGSYQPIVQQQSNRWIAYVGAESHTPAQLNSLTGQVEPNGTSILDVTDPRHPKYIAHIPGQGEADRGGSAQDVRVCSGNELPHGQKGKFYLLRNFGYSSWEMWDVTDPEKPNRLNVILTVGNTDKPWWECDTGIAYLPGGPLDWRDTTKGTDNYDSNVHLMIYDLSDPAKPVFIRSFGLPGQEPGSSVPMPPVGIHTVLSTGPKGNRVYMNYGNAGNGIVEILDRRKLLDGPKEPSDDNLRYPIVGRIDFPPDVGVHTSFPLPQVQLSEFSKQKYGSVKDFLIITGQGHKADTECQETRQILHTMDVTTESKPLGVATWTVPEASGNFCSRGGDFGSHSTNENFTLIYYNRMMFATFHNAGVRVLDVRDPYHLKEIAYYIPAITDKTNPSCSGKGASRQCKTVIDTNNVEVDNRGYIYITDSVGTGMHILQLTGSARELADFTKAEK
jgi:hypothetical protein